MIVGAAWQVFGDDAPLCALLLNALQNQLVLLLSPLLFDHVWVQSVVPALSALLADAARQILSNLAPALGSIA